MKDDLRRCLARLLVAGTVMGLLVGCTKSQNYEEAKSELAGLVEPAVKAALKGVDRQPDRFDDGDNCSDPFFGPSQGLRPTFTYRIPTSELGSDPRTFVLEAEKVWKSAGLETRTDDSEGLFSRSATKGSYALHAYVNFANAEATISGTGPCVKHPDA
jgi:hypothetical protein